MPLEIRPLAALYPPPLIQKICFIGLLISALRGDRGRYANGYGICAPFLLYQSKEILWAGGYNAVRGLVSRDIAFTIK